MGTNQKISGTPWHVTALGLKEGEEKRHRSRCVYYRGTDTYCQKRLGKCIGSSHCKYYHEESSEKPALEQTEKTNNSRISHDNTQISPLMQKIASFHVGDTVFHKKYGYGKILQIQDEIVTIDFKNEGTKKLNLKMVVEQKYLFH